MRVIQINKYESIWGVHVDDLIMYLQQSCETLVSRLGKRKFHIWTSLVASAGMKSRGSHDYYVAASSVHMLYPSNLILKFLAGL